jgi:RHS repeat-associated protein
VTTYCRTSDGAQPLEVGGNDRLLRHQREPVRLRDPDLHRNARNQLTATSGGTSSFLYDGLGRRIKTVVSGATTRYLYDGANPVQEQNNAGTPTADLLTGLGLDQTYQRTVSGTSYNYLSEALGSTVALVAGSTVSPEYTYEPYGASTQTGTIANPYRFTGREWDGATGLQFNRARYYNPTWGRFISEDPQGFAAGDPSLYRYVQDAPITAVDPVGLDSGGSWSWLCGGVSCGEIWSEIWRNPIGSWQAGRDDFCSSAPVTATIRYGSAFKTFDTVKALGIGAYNAVLRRHQPYTYVDYPNVASYGAEIALQHGLKAAGYGTAAQALGWASVDFTAIGTFWDVCCHD